MGKQGQDLDLQSKIEGKTSLRASLKMLPAFISTILKMQMKLPDLQREQNVFLVPLEFISSPSNRIPLKGNNATKKAWEHQEQGAKDAHPTWQMVQPPELVLGMQKPCNKFD